MCKINIAVDKIPNFLADPNTSEHTVGLMMIMMIRYDDNDFFSHKNSDDYNDGESLLAMMVTMTIIMMI